MSYKVMVVDDEPANLRLLERLFRRNYEVVTANSGDEALKLLEQHDVAVIITDQRMPGMTGIELLQRAAEMRPHTVRIILTGYTDVEALVEAINCGQVYKYVAKPWNNDDLRLTVTRALEHHKASKARYELELINQRLATRLDKMMQGFVRVIADALEAKDEHVHGHARRTSGYATAMGRRLGLDEESLHQLSLAAFLHDIGKIGTPERILLKTGPLTDEERGLMQLHPERGARMLSAIPEMEHVAEAVLHHHEHFNGTGYPAGLCGTQIPLASRIIVVADAYDAMTSPRPFRGALTHAQALEQLKFGSGLQFDPEVVRAFFGLDALAQIRASIAAGFCGELLIRAPQLSSLHGLTLDELIGEIESEPALAACVLREANLGGGNTLPTVNLYKACHHLGLARLREVLERRFAQHQCLSPNAGKLWERALRRAVAARLIARQTNIISPDEAYTLGLLHDVGEMLFNSLFPAEMTFMEDLDVAQRLEREVVAFGVEHSQVGQWLLESWGVPHDLAAILQTHHDIMKINRPAMLLLHLADRIARPDDSYNG
ncbi:MAG: HDOD domain-containing protein, partial [Acidobacteria bacterium]|nr:HDOD domain-containing protein [Acidobacteriota bacterium]